MISAWKWRHLKGCRSVMTSPHLLFSLNSRRSVHFLQHYRRKESALGTRARPSAGLAPTWSESVFLLECQPPDIAQDRQSILWEGRVHGRGACVLFGSHNSGTRRPDSSQRFRSSHNIAFSHLLTFSLFC